MKLLQLPLAPVGRRRPPGGRHGSVRRLSPPAAGETLWVPVPRAIRELMSTLSFAPAPGDDEEARMGWLDEVAVRLLAAVAPFCDEPRALVPAQRALLLVAGKPGQASKDVSGLSQALRHLDARLGKERGGFSRLLDAALSADEVLLVERLDPEGIEGELRPLARVLRQVGRELLAVDDLAHALSLRPDLAAGAVLLEGALDLAEGTGAVTEREGDDVLVRYVRRRHLDERLASLLALRAHLEDLDDGALERAAEGGVSSSLAVWLLARRLARQERLEDAADRAALEALLERAALVPLEVFDAASLWRDLDR